MEPDPQVGVEILAGAKLVLRDATGRDTALTAEKRENWMSLALPGEGTRVVHGLVDLGVRTRGQPHLLMYYPKAIVGDGFATRTVLGASVPLELRPVRAEGGFTLEFTVGGKPGANREVHLVNAAGEQTELVTGPDGLTPIVRGNGRFAAWARHWIDEAGERDGQAYQQVRRYATIVFDVPKPGDGSPIEASMRTVSVRRPMPEAASSFGAVECGGALYVYGGHVTDRHEYSTESISGRFHRMDLRTCGEWQELAGGPQVQGLNLATHGGKIYRAGGMEPRNAPGEAKDCRSIASAAYFDPASGRWSELPALPRPRSSHDVLVVGDSLYVVGGWWMKGLGEETEWLDTIDVLDLGASELRWRSIPQPFTRRALIGAVLGSRIFVIGGFDSEEEAQRDIDVLDVASGAWSKAPSIPGSSRNGFGPAACVHDGRLYLSVGTGELFRLASDSSAWELFARTTPRIVHRLIPFERELLVVGGAAEHRMVPLIEAVEVAGASSDG
jgi:hypothetical protein